MKATMDSIIRLLFVVLIFALVPACGGGGGDGGAPSPVVVLSDDFADLSNWTYGGSTQISSGGGNPPPSMFVNNPTMGGWSVTSDTYDFTSGITVSWHQYIVDGGSSTHNAYAGINSADSPLMTMGAGIQRYGDQAFRCYLNGVILYSVFSTVSPYSWAIYKVSIFADGTVAYYVNDVLVYHSTMTVSFTSPKNLFFTSSTYAYFDNVVVTIP